MIKTERSHDNELFRFSEKHSCSFSHAKYQFMIDNNETSYKIQFTELASGFLTANQENGRRRLRISKPHFRGGSFKRVCIRARVTV